MDSWLDVTFGGSHEPYIDRVVDEMPYITLPKTVAAFGTVDGYPWSLVLFQKQGDPEDEEGMAPDHRPKSARFEFFLGGSPDLPGSAPGGLGGGGGEINIRDGAHIDTTAHSWPTDPPIMGYVVFTSDDVFALGVNLDSTEGRSFPVERHLDGFPKFCIFFAPFAVPGNIAALDASGNVLHQRKLISGDVPVGAIFGGGD